MVLGSERKQESPEETQADIGRNFTQTGTGAITIKFNVTKY